MHARRQLTGKGGRTAGKGPVPYNKEFDIDIGVVGAGKYKDGLKYIYFYTKGTKGGNEEIKALLSYLRHSIIENVTDDATQSIHDSVEKIKHSAEVRGKYMTIGEIMDYNKAVGRAEGICEALCLLGWSDEEIIQKLIDMCGISREEAIEYVDNQALTEER